MRYADGAPSFSLEYCADLGSASMFFVRCFVECRSSRPLRFEVVFGPSMTGDRYPTVIPLDTDLPGISRLLDGSSTENTSDR